MTGELAADSKVKKKNITPEMLELMDIISRQSYKAMILYLLAETDTCEPKLVDLLSEMSRQEYLCFLCSPSIGGGIESFGHNLFKVPGIAMIPVFRNLAGIVLTIQNIPQSWNEILHHKLVWLHINDLFPEIRGDTFENADIISYFSVTQVGEELGSDPRSLPFDLEDGFINSRLLENKVRSIPKGWQVYANLDLTGKIAVMAASFLDFMGEFFYSGGAERYLLDLAEICEELGSGLMVFQYGDYPWMRRMKNIDIISLSRSEARAEGWILKCARQFNRIFYELVQGRTMLNIYSAFYEAWPLAATPNIGIIHGVSWDNPYCVFENAIEFWVMNQRYIEGAQACEELVSVDTNSANWFQTVDFDLSQRIKYIPNYVDLSIFAPREDYLDKREKTVILYPRQLYSARGLYLVLEIIDNILGDYPEVEFHFVGRGGEPDIGHIREKQRIWKERIKHYSLSLDEMAEAYRNADISLIPSVHSEGTSLSCLEAMACGNAVIATRVGGLSDLIISGYNGLLIDPRPEELKKAIKDLLENRDRLNLFKQRSPEVAQSFSHDLWRNHWISLLKNKIGNQSGNNVKKNHTIEVRLKDQVDYSKLGEFITEFLFAGDLVFVRTTDVPDCSLSFARIQWLGPETPLFSPCDLTFEWQGGFVIEVSR